MKDIKTSTVHARRRKVGILQTNETRFDQSFVQQFQEPLNYNLKQHEFNQLDYTLENWIDRRFTFQDIKNDYLRVVNGPSNQRVLKKSRQPLLEKQSLESQLEQNQSNQDNDSMDQSAIQFLDESEMQIKSYKDFEEQRNPKSVIEIESSDDDGNAVHVEQDSQQLYFVPRAKNKPKNIDLQGRQQVEVKCPKLTNLLLETLIQKNKRAVRRNFCKGKFQSGQIKRNIEVPDQLCIKLDD